MNIKTKKGKEVNIQVFENKDNTFKILPFDSNHEQLGFLTFKFLDKTDVWLYQVATYEKFRNQGVASLMLEVLEYVCAVQYGKTKIKGKFLPASFFAEQFYEANDYDIKIINYSPILEKELDKHQIEKNFLQKTNGKSLKVQSKQEEIQKIVEEAEQKAKQPTKKIQKENVF